MLTIDYAEHSRVTELIDVITYCAESVSLEFDHWDDSHVQGPGLYFVLVAGTSVAQYADPMGANRWPVEKCRHITHASDSFFETARNVAVESDGAVIVSVDGAVHEQMVRMKDLSDGGAARDDLEYADWMGARHMSALDTSLREEVIAAVTLSEETGRVAVFEDGDYVDYERDELGHPWRGRE